MTRHPLATMLIALSAVSASTAAQTVYKCGNAYTDRPCPKGTGGEVVDVADPRTPEQKAQADADTRRLARTADEMEKKRLNDEARALAVQRPINSPVAAAPAASVPLVQRRVVRRHASAHTHANAPQTPPSAPRPNATPPRAPAVPLQGR